MFLIIRVLYIIRMIRIRPCTLLFRFLQRQEADSFSAAADVMDGDDGAVVFSAWEILLFDIFFFVFFFIFLPDVKRKPEALTALRHYLSGCTPGYSVVFLTLVERKF